MFATWVLGLSGTSIAAEPTAPPIKAAEEQRAQELFDSAYQLAQKGDYDGAARMFEEAHALSPNASVLFNLGQARAATGDPVGAHAAFERYLAERQPNDGGPQRERLVRELMALAEQRIGQLLLDIEPAGSSIEIDGLARGSAPLDRALRLKAGAHALVVRHAEHQVEALNISIEAGKQTREVVRLQPPKSAPQPGFLLLRCGIPDLEIAVGTHSIGKTPWHLPIPLVPGEHVVQLTRPGYAVQVSPVSIQPGAESWLECAGTYAALSPRDGARLSVGAGLSGAAGARVYVDGRPWSARDSWLPIGRHFLEVRAQYFEPWQAELSLAPGERRELAPALVPTEAYRQEQTLERDRHVLWSGIALGAGITLSATAVALGVLNAGKRSRWEDEKRGLNGELANTTEGTANLRAHYEEALVIQRMDHATLASAVLGAISFGVSGALWFSAPAVPVAHEAGFRASLGRLGLRYDGRF